MISNGDFNSYVRLPGISQVYTSCRPGENSLRTFQKILSNKGACLETPYSVHFRMIIHNYIYIHYIGSMFGNVYYLLENTQNSKELKPSFGVEH